jgi:hypothetical protein
MAPRPKKRAAAAPSHAREYKVRLTEDVAHWIEERALDERRPQNRVIIDCLARYPNLERHPGFREMMGDMEIILSRYSARIVTADLTDELMGTLREMVKADDDNNIGVLRAKVAKVRTILNVMEKHVHKPRRNT